MLQFLDANILLYSISRDPKEAAKRDRAVGLLEDDSCALSIQVLQEFYVQATRANRADAISHEAAAGLIESWTRFRVQEMNFGVLRKALEIRKKYRFSFWDSAVIAAALALECDRLLTEDLRHGQRIEGLRIANPFR